MAAVNQRPPITFDSVMNVFKNSHPLIQTVVLAFFSHKKEEAHKFMGELIEGIREDSHGTEFTRNEAAEGLQHLIEASNKMTDDEREFLRLKIRQEFRL